MPGPDRAENLEPDTHGIPVELVDELEQLDCCYCREPLSRYEMLAVWAAGNFTAHLHCWAQHHGVVTSNREATS